MTVFSAPASAALPSALPQWVSDLEFGGDFTLTGQLLSENQHRLFFHTVTDPLSGADTELELCLECGKLQRLSLCSAQHDITMEFDPPALHTSGHARALEWPLRQLLPLLSERPEIQNAPLTTWLQRLNLCISFQLHPLPF